MAKPLRGRYEGYTQLSISDIVLINELEESERASVLGVRNEGDDVSILINIDNNGPELFSIRRAEEILEMINRGDKIEY